MPTDPTKLTSTWKLGVVAGLVALLLLLAWVAHINGVRFER